MDPCPLVFSPILKPKIWGAQNLARLFNKPVPSLEKIGETWECADLETAQSIVARGPASGKSLNELVDLWGPRLLGRAAPVDGRFPLLIKFLDAAENLSIQVHPDEATARALGGKVRIKHEAWHVLHAAPGAAIYRGLAHGITREDLARAARADPASIPGLLNKIPVKPGDTFYLPSGTPHALGAGVVVAEIQTPSDITYRLYDWGRTRPAADAGLHIDQALDCIQTDVDFSPFEKRSHVTSVFTTVTRLVNCPSFTIEKVRFAEGIEQDIPYAELVIWIVLSGSGEIGHGKPSDSSGKNPNRETFSPGDVIVLPADLKNPRLKTRSDCTWLEVTIPASSDLADFPRPATDVLRAPPAANPIPLSIAPKRRP